MQDTMKEQQYMASGKVQPFGQPRELCISSRACLVCSSHHSTANLRVCPGLRMHHRSWAYYESSTGFEGYQPDPCS